MSLSSEVLAAINRIGAEIKAVRILLASKGSGNVVGVGITRIEKVTQAQYNAIGTKDPATLYVIVG